MRINSQTAAAATAAGCDAEESTGLHQNSDTSADDPWLDDSETRS